MIRPFQTIHIMNHIILFFSTGNTNCCLLAKARCSAAGNNGFESRRVLEYLQPLVTRCTEPISGLTLAHVRFNLAAALSLHKFFSLEFRQ